MEDSLMRARHSLAHLLAQAIQRYIDPQVQLGTGPAIDTGFYYDVLFSDGITFSSDQLKDLTKKIQLIAKEPQTYVVYECPVEHGYEINALTHQSLKNELLDKFTAQGEQFITYYLNVAPKKTLEFLRDAVPGYQEMYLATSEYFQNKGVITEEQAIVYIDLCAGPHVETTKDLDAGGMVLEKVAGAYWQADENNAQMTRIYGLSFENKEALQKYQTMMEEAKKRDHRILGKQLNIYSISDLVGAGFPLMHPNGMTIRKELEDYLRELHKTKGYQRVWTPHLAKIDLYKTSGHYDHYKENFQVKGREEDFMVKPMNCPHHMQIFDAQKFSYRDMPVRYFEPATVYRDEKSGQLSGLTRVRALTQDDGHLFCRTSQIEQEVSTIVEIIKSFYTTMGMIDEYRVSLSVRDDSDDYLGTKEVRATAEAALQEAADANNLPYKRIEGEAAFYGPKLDFMFKDAVGREWQLATIQCDFNLPERFNLSFINEQGEQERPVVIHRAISGSLERFMGVMIEHFAGAFPLWLAPEQIRVIPVADAFLEYAQEVVTLAQNNGLRATIDQDENSFSKKIRNAELEKIPYIVIVGEKEVSTKTLAIREYKTKNQYEIALEEFIQKCKHEYETRVL